MVEHVQVRRRLVSPCERAMAGLAVLYAALVSPWLAAPYGDPTFYAFVFFVVAVIAIPLAFKNVLGFRIACLTVAAVLLPFGFVLMIAGMFVYWPAVVPLALAASPMTRRHPHAALAGAGSLLLGAPLAYSTWVI